MRAKAAGRAERSPLRLRPPDPAIQSGGTVAAAPALAPRGRIRPHVIYLGWQHMLPSDGPGPMPVGEAAAELAEVSGDWLTAQRRGHRRPARTARLGAVAGAGIAGTAAGSGLAGMIGPAPALLAALAGTGLAVTCLRAVVASERALRAAIRAERLRVREIRQAQETELDEGRRRQARSYREWQLRAAASWRQPGWYPVHIPADVGRLDLAGGTLPGWSALLTTIAATRLAAGGSLTVLDLTEGGVATDLVGLAAALGIDPQVWVLPADLPRLDLGLHFSRETIAEVLALTVAAAETGAAPPAGGAGPADPARDAALLDHVLEALGPGASLAQLTAGLRALAQIGEPHRQLAGGVVSPDQLTRLGAMFGRGADHLVVDRAWALETRLRTLSTLGTSAAGLAPSPLRVLWPDRRASATGNRVLGSYLTVALTEVLRQAPAGRPWQQTFCLLGADRLPGDVLDRLCDAAEAARAGLVLGYRTIPPQVRERLGRGNSALAVMRLGNAEDARAAAEQIGSEHRFVVSQFTDTVGASVTDTAGDSYTSTVGTSDSVADSRSATLTAGRSRGRARPVTFAPFAEGGGSASRDSSHSVAVSDSRSITVGISESTSWGLATSRAVGASDSRASTRQRSRELIIEQHELQHLPHTAVVICHRGPAGRLVQLADANPAIMTLPTATLTARPYSAARPSGQRGSRS
jgi:hypothetical protein